MQFVVITSLCVAFLLAADAVVRKTDFFSPIRIYVFFHALTLGIAFMAFDKAMTPFQPLTSIVYFGSAASFVLGAGIISLMPSGYPRTRLASVAAGAFYKWKRHLLLATSLGLLFVVGLLIARVGAGEFPLLAEDKGKAIRMFFSISWFSNMTISHGGLVGALYFMALVHSRKRSWLRMGSLLLMAGALALYLLALSRSGLLFFSFFTIVYYNYAVKRLPILKLGGVFLVLVVFFVGTTALKVNQLREQSDVDVEADVLISTLLKMPYFYVANNYWNLDYALNIPDHRGPHPPTYGFTTISGFYDLMRMPGGTVGDDIRSLGNYDDQYHESSVKVKGLNTIGYQWGLYKDFGVTGALLIPFLFGFLVSLLYRRVLATPTVLNVSAYSYLAFLIGFSWFLALWESVIFFYGFFLTVGFAYLCTSRAEVRGDTRESPVTS